MLTDNLDKLIAQKRINKNILSKESGIPYTTIDGLYKKGADNTKLSTLVKLADYFEISLDELILGDKENTPAAEDGRGERVKQFAELFSKLSDDNQDLVLSLLESLSKKQ